MALAKGFASKQEGWSTLLNHHGDAWACRFSTHGCLISPTGSGIGRRGPTRGGVPPRDAVTKATATHGANAKASAHSSPPWQRQTKRSNSKCSSTEQSMFCSMVVLTFEQALHSSKGL